MKYDLIVIGSGPGGYVAAIRAAQLGLKTAVVEKSELGGICLNWGCIPTKALLKSAQVYKYASHAVDYGVKIEGDVKPDLTAMVERSRGVANGMSNGIQFLLKKNKVDHIAGFGKLMPGKKVEVTDADGKKQLYEAEHIVLATGARSRELPNLKQDGEKIIGYREAMTLKEQPESMLVVGSGAIGSEFAYFYNTIGTKVTLVEFMPNILPLEDVEVSKQMERSFKKAKMKVMTNSSVESVDTSGDKCIVTINTKKGEQQVECDIVLSAVGVTTNLEGIGLEETGVKTEKGKVLVDDYYRTNVDGVYAIGDIVHGPALAHVASHEGIICVEKIAGHEPEVLDYNNIPACTYTVPEVASVGMTEQQAKDAGYEIKVGKFPYTASGKASAAGNKEGFIKVVFDAKYGEWLGAHMVGENVTEMIAEAVVARKLETTAREIIDAVHPHPTMSEAVMEAVAAAYDEVVHI
jgi:dihydrolipoamide dehydrogenase